jgi:hypothetical protein
LVQRLAAAKRRGKVAFFVQVNLLAIAELADGVVAELDADRVSNARRLVRHLWEFEVEFSYVLADPEPRLKQWRATEARRQARIRAEGEVPASPFDRLLADDYERAREEDGFLPSLQQMAESLGRHERYRVEYRPLSALSHPGLWGTARYSDVTEEDVEAAWAGRADVDAIKLRRVELTHQDRTMVIAQCLLCVFQALTSIYRARQHLEIEYADLVNELRELDARVVRVVAPVAQPDESSA